MNKRVKQSDTRAHDRPNAFKWNFIWDFNNEMLMTYVWPWVSTEVLDIWISANMPIFLQGIICMQWSSFKTERFLSCFAHFTFHARINDAAHCNIISNFDLSNLWTNFNDSSRKLMARYNRIHSITKMIQSKMAIRMAYSTILHLKFDIIFLTLGPIDPYWLEFLPVSLNRPCYLFILIIECWRNIHDFRLFFVHKMVINRGDKVIT